MNQTQRIFLANPRGFCAGVDRAIEIVERALELLGAPIYVRHEVVHNRFVVESLRERGAIFVDQLDDVPDGQTVIFSAHGVPQTVREEAQQRQLRVFDATCPLVTKVHLEVARRCRDGYEVILIGHRGHPEVEGTMGQCTDDSTNAHIHLVVTLQDVEQLEINSPEKIAFVTQTTLSIDDTQQIISTLQNRFPKITGPKKNDICYATQNRQDAVKELARNCDLVLVVGSPNSSNSNRLREIAEKHGPPAYLIDGAQDIETDWLVDKHHLGVTAGASAPEILVENVIDKLKAWGYESVIETQGKAEEVVFALPKSLLVDSAKK
ncbi:MAG: 4-hydroxy-3-methylbut-2-enyl diphosphate reductase [Candidatus Thiodiazotropha sp. (ex Lucinoma aequizonata)]|nr:4-hydroxy-3-methylbut-2-enyl diphosphate reductase [Candidatus Thiodiazotropha sp. (ex Lucinoma aequizonata)]MCU7888460.1 4-hydroxy-3-methylbut-2-enyl diphosphate reductase [Candidatus Thiodiazotropha sp. (ex Lucinoma aequizonata)]MCU7897015.1 4-hydroxy-3-methylbut-2-enyl diphosphate reductase [Candidatus Thiodiazotropha sp. (ex Lucinoma aequizonata)]MCU7897564.1 4-hydroxy-3-methylbut-2-enyl diphosphate reductase [Candidatus Thiodiazotropha sp. (ex Lucinoma aequizonata)]MCU7901904.1 4-hydrox